MTSATLEPLTLAHARTPAWLLALYLAIYGGDPPPPTILTGEQQEEAALHLLSAVTTLMTGPAAHQIQMAIKSATRELPGSARLHFTSDPATIAARLTEMGIAPTTPEKKPGSGEVNPQTVVCYGTQSGLRCVNIPVHVLE